MCVYRQTGKLLEKYDVITTDRPGGGGEYPTQDGFGWTNGVTRKLMALYPADADLASVDQCSGREGGYGLSYVHVMISPDLALGNAASLC